MRGHPRPSVPIPTALPLSAQVGCKDFAKAVIERIGRVPRVMLPMVEETPDRVRAGEIQHDVQRWTPPPQQKILTGKGRPRRHVRGCSCKSHLYLLAFEGVDVFLDWSAGSPDELAALLNKAVGSDVADGLELKLITSRGVKVGGGRVPNGRGGAAPLILTRRPCHPCQVWPNGFPETFLVDHWRCRFRPSSKDVLTVDYSSVLKIMAALHAHGLDVIKVGHGREWTVCRGVAKNAPPILTDRELVLLQEPRRYSYARLLAGPGGIS